jgi:hypothetical protein
MHTTSTSTTSARLAARSSDIEEFANRLRSISERARKLLIHITELACHGRGKQRKPDVAYLPELYESCGLGVEEMYPLLNELKAAGLIEVENQYPFEDIRILPVASGWHAVADLSQFAEKQEISLRDLLVNLRFDLLR